MRTNELKSIQDARSEPNLSLNRIQKYGSSKVAEGDFQRLFRQILKVRVPGSEGSRQVRQVLIQFFVLMSIFTYYCLFSLSKMS